MCIRDRLHRGRGIEQVFPLLNKFQTAHYLILGEGQYIDDLEKKTVDLGVQNRVHFFGSVPYLKLMSYTASATIGFSLIQPLSQSYEHALPNKIFEYAAVGLPIIATDLPEMNKAITDYNLGYCVRFGDEVALAELVEKILLEVTDGKYEPKNQLFWEAQTDKLLEIL